MSAPKPPGYDEAYAAALAEYARDIRASLKPGDTAQLHDVGCTSLVGEPCNCEPIHITATAEQS